MIDTKDILETALERFKNAYDSDRSERDFAADDLRFGHNEDNAQWPKEIKAQRESDWPPRPCLSLNKIPEKIDLVEGEFRQLKPSYKIRGVDDKADSATAEIIAGLVRHIEYNSNARVAYNGSHNSTLYCGRGAWRIDIDDAEDDPFVRDIKINRIADVFSVVFDPASTAPDKSDARYCFVYTDVPEDDFKRDYPDADITQWPTDKYWVDWRKDKRIRVAEYWYKDITEVEAFKLRRADENSYKSVVVYSKEEIDPLNDIVEQSKKVKRTVLKRCLMTASDIIEQPTEWPTTRIPIVFEVGKTVNVDGQDKHRGMVRHTKTPIQMYNYWSSSVTEQIALSPKAPYLITPKMLDGFQNGWWDQANVRNFAYLPYNPDPLAPGGRPSREVPAQLSTAIASELARMEHDIMSAMGIYESSLGDSGQEKSGRAIMARQKQGNLGSYTFTDNFQTALTYSIRVIVELIPYVYDTERVVRILGDDMTERTIPINAGPQSQLLNADLPKDMLAGPRPGITEYWNDLTVGKYDVVVSIGPSYDTQRQERLAVLMDLIQNVPQFGQAALDIIVKSMDMPGGDELVKRARKMVPIGIRDPEPGEETPEQQPDPAMILAMKKLELEGLKEMREAFEGKMDAIAKLITAEARERGNQITEIATVVDHLKQRAQMEQQARQQPTQPVQEQPMGGEI